MKICAIICEFNPFHNGHAYLLEQAKKLTGCDKILCIMSGYFTQRGEIAVIDKYSRARHAVLGGADCVIELPTAFAVAPAEIFATGAVKILSSIPDVKALIFGCETDDKDLLYKTADFCLNETEDFKRTLNKGLQSGESYIKSFVSAFEQSGGCGELLKKPNNVLAVEYVKAIIKSNADLDIYPLKRIGSNYNDENLTEGLSSARAIRENLNDVKISVNVPKYVYTDLKNTENPTREFEKAAKLVLSRTSANELKKIYGCAEGLENTLKNLEYGTYQSIVKNATTKRYSSARIKRIICSAFLGITKNNVENFLSAPLYLSPLAVNRNCADEMLSSLSKSVYPLITNGRNAQNLQGVAKKCKKLDEFATAQWRQITGNNIDNKLIII